MAELTEEWIAALQRPHARVAVLATLAFGEHFDDTVHPAEMQAALRTSSERGIEVSDSRGRALPFWPTLVQRPVVSRSWAPEDGRSATTTSQLVLGREADLNRWVDSTGYGGGLVRIDLWTDGVDLASTFPLLTGRFSLAGKDYRDSFATIDAVDGLLDAGAQTTDGKISAVDFPDAPAAVLGIADQQVILGAYPDGVPIYPIDQTGLRYYVCSHPSALSPNRVRSGTFTLATPFRVRTRLTARGRAYTAIEFQTVPASLGIGPLVCSGGVGIATDSPILTLLESAGFGLTARARTALLGMPIRQDVFIGGQVDVLELVTKRLLPQTTGILAWRNGLIDILRWDQPVGQMTLAPGLGLIGRLPSKSGGGLTDVSAVYNSVEIEFGRDASGQAGNGGLGKVTVGPGTPGPIGALAAASVRHYGDRPLQMTGSNACIDLATAADAIRLGEKKLELLALPHRIHTYSAEWIKALTADLNTEVPLTDPREELSGLPCRVRSIDYGAPRPVMTMMEEGGVSA